MDVQVCVDNRIRVPMDHPRSNWPAVLEQLKSAFTYENPDYAQFESLTRLVSRDRGNKAVYAQYMALKGTSRTIETWKVQNGFLTLPRGGMWKVREVLSQNLVTHGFLDQRTEGKNLGKFTCAPTIKLYGYQERLVEAALEKENCLWRSGTGSGKTTAALNFAIRCRVPTIVVVWNSNLFEQWFIRAQTELGIAKEDVGIVRGPTKKLKPVTIAMQQTLYKCVDEIAPNFGCVILDEVQRASARTVYDVIDAFPARYRLGVSASEQRKDKREFLTYDIFGQVAAEVTREDLIDLKFVHDVEVRMVPTEFSCDWYRVLEGQAKAFAHTRLLEEMTSDTGRNRIAIELATLASKEGERSLMFSHRVNHCHFLLNDLISKIGSRTGMLIGGTENLEEFRRTVAGIHAGEVDVAVGTYQAIGVGIDLPSITRGLCVTPVHTNKEFFNQVRGRLCRTSKNTNKRNAVLYYLWDLEIYGKKPLENMLKWNSQVTVQLGSEVVDGQKYLEGM